MRKTMVINIEEPAINISIAAKIANSKTNLIEILSIRFVGYAKISSIQTMHLLSDKDNNVIFASDTINHLSLEFDFDESRPPYRTLYFITNKNNKEYHICDIVFAKGKVYIDYDMDIIANVNVSVNTMEDVIEDIGDTSLANLVKFKYNDYSFAREEYIYDTLLYGDYPVAAIKVKKYDDHVKKILLPIVHDFDTDTVGTIDIELDHVFIDTDNDGEYPIYDPYSVSKDKDNHFEIYLGNDDSNVIINCGVGGINKSMFTLIWPNENYALYGTNIRISGSEIRKILIDIYESMDGNMTYINTKEIVPLQVQDN